MKKVEKIIPAKKRADATPPRRNRPVMMEEEMVVRRVPEAVYDEPLSRGYGGGGGGFGLGGGYGGYGGGSSRGRGR